MSDEYTPRELDFEKFSVPGMPDVQGVEFIGYSDVENCNGAEISDWLGELGWDSYHEVRHSYDLLVENEEIRIKMPTGTTKVNPGDWVLEDAIGQIYVLPQSVVWKKWNR